MPEQTNYHFTPRQLTEYKKKLHSAIHRLLVDVETNNIHDLPTSYKTLLLKIDSLNQILGDQDAIIYLFTTLLAAYEASRDVETEFAVYRKLILDAHTALDNINFHIGELCND